MSSFHGILLHVVFATAGRRRWLVDGCHDPLFGEIGAIARSDQATLLKAGGVEDHVHLLLKIHPSVAIANTIRKIKANSSRWFNELPSTKTKFRWQKGYAAFSVSESLSDTVKTYIANQQQHHQRKSFRDEYLGLLHKHRITFDERYVFDEEWIG